MEWSRRQATRSNVHVSLFTALVFLLLVSYDVLLLVYFDPYYDSFICLLCYWSFIMLCDSRHPCFENFDSVTSIDVNRMSSVDDPARNWWEAWSINVTWIQTGACPVSLAFLKSLSSECEQTVYLFHVLQFSLFLTSVGQTKNSEAPRGTEPQTFGFRAGMLSMLYHWTYC